MKEYILEHGNMFLRFHETGKEFGLRAFQPKSGTISKAVGNSYPNFDLTVAGETYNIYHGTMLGASAIPLQAECIQKKFSENGVELVYIHSKYQIEITINLEFVPGVDVIRQSNRVKNIGDSEITLTRFTSMHTQGIAMDGLLPWYDSKKIRVHYCRSHWTGEGQWRCSGLEELGLYPSSVHNCSAAIQIGTVGSWSTNKYIPAAMIEDTETGQIWYFQIESSSSWGYEIGYNVPDSESAGSLYMSAGCADESRSGWYKKLQPGEEYIAMPVAFGCTLGGFEEAVAELTKYRRSYLKPTMPAPFEAQPPVIYNDYMNALWGHPTQKRLLALIERAEEIGAEIFCIDAGWFGTADAPWEKGLGDWEVSDELGIRDIIQLIESKGLRPGLWLEFDACMIPAKAYEFSDDCFLSRYGMRIGGNKAFWDFRNAKALEYLNQKIDYLIGLGVSYFKNDYNTTTGLGDDKNGSAAEGLIENVKATYAFWENVRKRHPHVVIENCASGGLRQDYGILSRFHLQSITDQEEYYHMPSILMGTLANIVPEQAGIWAYPYPLPFLESNCMDTLTASDYAEQMQDGEQTIFNMVNGMCGLLYLSGMLHLADELNLNLIREGVETYKKIRPLISCSVPVWPTKMLAIGDQGYASFGLVSYKDDIMLLAVWRLKTDEDFVNIDLSKWTGKEATVGMLYPSDSMGVQYAFHSGNRSLTVGFPKKYSARLFKIKLH